MNPHRLVVGLFMLSLSWPAAAQLDFNKVGVGGQSAPSGQIQAQDKTGAKPAADPSRDAKTTRLFDYLEKEYGILLTKQKDRASRSLLIISMSKVPRNGATRTLLDMLKKESDPLVRAVAWECLLARLPMLTQNQYTELVASTHSLFNAGIIRGHMRAAALDLLSVSTPDKAAKDLWGKIYLQTDSRQPGDDDVIEALGNCLGQWKSGNIAEYLVGRMTVLDEAFRAHRILAAAGAPIGADQIKFDAGDAECLRLLAATYASWWAKESANWKDVKISLEDGRWRKLGPHLIDAPEPVASVNPDDKKWRRDLELRPPQLKSFDVGLVVDVTGSMGPALAWLRQDVKKLMAGAGVLAYEPRIGLTFYRDHGDEFVTRHLPLTGKVDLLLQALTQMDAKGGADLPEAVFEAMTESLKSSNWSSGASSRRVMVLVADAPAHEKTQKQCEDLAAEAAGKGFKVYCVKVNGPYASPEISLLDPIVRAGKGISLDASSTELSDAHGRTTARQCVLRAGYSAWSIRRPAAGLGSAAAGGEPVAAGGMRLGGGSSSWVSRPVDAPATDGSYMPGEGPTGRRLLSAILVDAINPQYADRVEPMAAVLWELLQEPSTEKQAPFKPYNPVAHMREPGMRGERMKEPDKPVKGPQDR